MIQSISILLGFAAAALLAYLTHRFPQKQFQALEDLSKVVLIAISLTAAQYERSLRSPLDDYWVVCPSGVYAPGSADLFQARFINGEECKTVRMRKNPLPRLGSDLLNWLKDTLISAWLDLPGDVLGLYAGIRLAGGKAPKLREVLLKRDDGL